MSGSTAAAERRVNLYGRPGCHLCDDARESLLQLASEVGGFEVVEVNIDTDDDLLRRHLESIPVVEFEGEVVSSLIFSADRLREALTVSRVR